MEEITKTQWWLIYHQCIAFWHEFGISNGLEIPKEDTYIVRTDEKGNYRKNGTKEFIVIKPDVMRKKLDTYIRYLKTYKESWDTKEYEDCPVQCREDIENCNDLSFIKVLEMIDLLQR
ncbi:hypothetical protein DRJ17_05725 [Candidatus Woesearchaeota archaeon]|nr:MAG: hypothetical protein DRJ17_05725 [Candidatus Woesearchaeota archaeon]